MSVAGAPMVNAPAVDILGTPVIAVGWDEGIRLMAELIRRGEFTRISFLNAHNANVAARDPEFRDAISHFLILPDGVGVDVASKALYGRPFPANLNGTDFIPGLLQGLDFPVKVGLLGATQVNIEMAAVKLREIAPKHDYQIISHGFFGPDTEAEVMARLAEYRPDILLVAMGVPRQELWIMKKLTPELCTLSFGVGALIDFLSGAVPRAPLWVRRWRLEWMYRLYQEPGRLWRRYIVGNPVFLYRVAREKLRRMLSHG